MGRWFPNEEKVYSVPDLVSNSDGGDSCRLGGATNHREPS